MTYFKLDLSKLDQNISNYIEESKVLKENIELVYSNLGYVDSAWSDLSSWTFQSEIKKNEQSIYEYIDFIDFLYKSISEFKSNIGDICYKYGYDKNSTELTFDNTKLQLCKESLSKILLYLKNGLYYANLITLSINFSYTDMIYRLISEMEKIQQLITNLLANIDSFSTKIENEILISQEKMAKMSEFYLNLKPVIYNWKVNDLYFEKAKIDDLDSTYTNSYEFRTPSFSVNHLDLSNNTNLVSTNKQSSLSSINVKVNNLDTNTIKASDNVDKMQADIRKNINLDDDNTYTTDNKYGIHNSISTPSISKVNGYSSNTAFENSNVEASRLSIDDDNTYTTDSKYGIHNSISTPSISKVNGYSSNTAFGNSNVEASRLSIDDLTKNRV